MIPNSSKTLIPEKSIRIGRLQPENYLLRHQANTEILITASTPHNSTDNTGLWEADSGLHGACCDRYQLKCRAFKFGSIHASSSSTKSDTRTVAGNGIGTPPKLPQVHQTEALAVVKLGDILKGDMSQMGGH